MTMIWSFRVTPDGGTSPAAIIEATRTDNETGSKVPTLKVSISHQDISTPEKRKKALDKLYLDVPGENTKLTKQVEELTAQLDEATKPAKKGK